jgi:hypothetical protein
MTLCDTVRVDPNFGRMVLYNTAQHKNHVSCKQPLGIFKAMARLKELLLKYARTKEVLLKYISTTKSSQEKNTLHPFYCIPSKFEMKNANETF